MNPRLLPGPPVPLPQQDKLFLGVLASLFGQIIQVSPAGHLAMFGPKPSLGALQAGIASQSIAGCDSVHIITLVTTGAPPAAGALIAIVAYATPWTQIPATWVCEDGTGIIWVSTAANSKTGYNVFHGGTQAGVAALAANTTYFIVGLSLGAGSF